MREDLDFVREMRKTKIKRDIINKGGDRILTKFLKLKFLSNKKIRSLEYSETKEEINMTIERYLGIIGTSGVGKTTMMNKLINDYPSLFFKVDQATTRDIRDDEIGDAYIWLNSKRDYKKIEHLLIAKTEVRGSLYGSIPVAKEGKIGIIILNEKGLLDLTGQPYINRDNYYIVGLDRPLTEIPVKRDGRNVDYLQKEREVLKYADIVLSAEGRNEYVKPEKVMAITKEFFEL